MESSRGGSLMKTKYTNHESVQEILGADDDSSYEGPVVILATCCAD